MKLDHAGVFNVAVPFSLRPNDGFCQRFIASKGALDFHKGAFMALFNVNIEMREVLSGCRYTYANFQCLRVFR